MQEGKLEGCKPAIYDQSFLGKGLIIVSLPLIASSLCLLALTGLIIVLLLCIPAAVLAAGATPTATPTKVPTKLPTPVPTKVTPTVAPTSAPTTAPAVKTNVTAPVKASSQTPANTPVKPTGPPTVTAITPSWASLGSIAQKITLTGTNFTTGAAVKLTRYNFGDIKASNVVVVSPTQITATLNLQTMPLGPWIVVVTNPDGSTAKLPGYFTVKYVRM